MSSTFSLKGKIFLLDVIDFLSFFLFITGIVLFIRFFIINPYTVVGSSMEPNFHENDFILVDKITPRMGSLKRGDIVVFVPQGKHLPFIKRIVGLPGEKVRILENKVYICDQEDVCRELNELYLPEDFITSTTSCGKDVFVLDENGYFVLGDNREHSTDSRCCFGFACYENTNYQVHPKDIIGKVLIRIYPHMKAFWNQDETKKLQNTLSSDSVGSNTGTDLDDALLKGLEEVGEN